MQFGCCCVYIVFIADNLKEVFNEEFDLTWSNKKYICILAPLFLMLACVRHINLLAKLSSEFMLYAVTRIADLTLAQFVNSTQTKRTSFHSFWKLGVCRRFCHHFAICGARFYPAEQTSVGGGFQKLGQRTLYRCFRFRR